MKETGQKKTLQRVREGLTARQAFKLIKPFKRDPIRTGLAGSVPGGQAIRDDCATSAEIKEVDIAFETGEELSSTLKFFRLAYDFAERAENGPANCPRDCGRPLRFSSLKATPAVR